MTWAKLDDGTDEELEYLSHAAHRLFIDTITLSRRRNLGGILAPVQLTPAMRRLHIPAKTVAELLALGPDGEPLWLKDGENYQIRNYEKFNPLTSTERVRKHRRNRNGTQGNTNETLMEPSLVRASATGLETIRTSGSRPVPLPEPGAFEMKPPANGADQAARLRAIAARVHS
jgi:hypothetical protein